TQDISIDQIRTIVLARAAFPPHEGRAKVFIVRRAEELSVAAANALLKTLEEPGARTHFILLSAAPDTLLPTIRSRTLRIRFGLLPDHVVTDLLVERGVEHAASIALVAKGSMATALALGDPEASARRDDFVARALRALETSDVGEALDLAEEAKKESKDLLVSGIEALALALGGRAREAAKRPDRTADVATGRYALALATLRHIDGNASTQLAVEAMLIKMRAL
ncbi:MAG: ATP-binding protein, partial [Polyangiaceae bacterium]